MEREIDTVVMCRMAARSAGISVSIVMFELGTI
jgi:hypothetical protein